MPRTRLGHAFEAWRPPSWAISRARWPAADLHSVELVRLDVPVNDVVAVTAEEGDFALSSTTGLDAGGCPVGLDLVDHLIAAARRWSDRSPGRAGCFSASSSMAGSGSAACSPGRPGPSRLRDRWSDHRLGAAAARIHQAADGFAPSPDREVYDAALLIDDQLDRMRPLLEEVGCWAATVGLTERRRTRLADPALDQGICTWTSPWTTCTSPGSGTLTVFDFDSAGPSWRAVEPYGVLRYSAPGFRSSLRDAGPYARSAPRTRRRSRCSASSATYERSPGGSALAVSSRGALIDAAALPAIVDGWLAWEATHLTE